MTGDDPDAPASPPPRARQALRECLAPLYREVAIEKAEAIIDGIFADAHEMDRPHVIFRDRNRALLEARIGARFGMLSGYTHIRLAPKATHGHDLILRRGDATLAFDVTEAMDPTRNRMSEYESPIQTIARGDPDEMESEFVKRVGKSLKTKADPQKNLIVYVNTGPRPPRTTIEAAVARWRDSFGDRFASAYLLFSLGADWHVMQIAPHEALTEGSVGQPSP